MPQSPLVRMKKATTAAPSKVGASKTRLCQALASAPVEIVKPPTPPKSPEFVRVITATKTGTIIRNLRIPRGPPSSEILPTRDDLIIAEESKKLHMQEKQRICDQTCAEAERTAKEINQKILDRAHYLQMEQEYDIRNLNSIIIGAKFNALNEAKVAENIELREKFLKEQKALDALDNLTNKKFWDVIDERERLKRVFRVERRKGINEQIMHNLEVKRRIAEENLLEGQRIREVNEKKELQAIIDKKRKKEEDRRMHEDNLRVNDIIMTQEKRKKELQLLEIMHMENVRKKMESDDNRFAEQKRIREEKDRRYDEGFKLLVKENERLAEIQKQKVNNEKIWRRNFHLQRINNVADHRLNKLKYLKSTGLPDIYLSSVERKAGFIKDDSETNMGNMWNSRIPDIPKIKISHKYWSYI